jgi:hypothetical protein
MILRPISPDSSEVYQIVGECYVHGLSDAVGLLGHIPYPWRPIILGDAMGRARQWFLNRITGERTTDDPRLGPLPYENWDRAVYERRTDDPAIFERFVHLETGETINYDPRMSPEALKARSVELQTFKIV